MQSCLRSVCWHLVHKPGQIGTSPLYPLRFGVTKVEDFLSVMFNAATLSRYVSCEPLLPSRGTVFSSALYPRSVFEATVVHGGPAELLIAWDRPRLQFNLISDYFLRV